MPQPKKVGLDKVIKTVIKKTNKGNARKINLNKEKTNLGRNLDSKGKVERWKASPGMPGMQEKIVYDTARVKGKTRTGTIIGRPAKPTKKDVSKRNRDRKVK